MLGSLDEADDAVQEPWIRLSRSDSSGVENIGGWLTTDVSRVCLDMLRSRTSRREEPLGTHLPEPNASREDRVDPEHATLLAGSAGFALLVVLDTLTPAERRIRAAQHVRRALRQDPASRGALRDCGTAARQPCTSPGARGGPGARRQSRQSAGSSRRLPRCLARGRLRSAAGAARSRCRAPSRSHGWRHGRIEGGPRRTDRGGYPLGACLGGTTGARGWGRETRVGSGQTAAPYSASRSRARRSSK